MRLNLFLSVHLIKVNLLPMSGEKAIWDNTIYLPVEVMSNTIGVLHILGALVGMADTFAVI